MQTERQSYARLRHYNSEEILKQTMYGICHPTNCNAKHACIGCICEFCSCHLAFTTQHSAALSPWSRHPSAEAMKAESHGRRRGGQQQAALKSVDFIWQEITAVILFATRFSSLLHAYCEGVKLTVCAKPREWQRRSAPVCWLLIYSAWKGVWWPHCLPISFLMKLHASCFWARRRAKWQRGKRW